MARRKRASRPRLLPAFSLLPWWAWLALAVAAYAGMRGLAAADLTAILLAGEFDRLAQQTPSDVLIAAGQFLLPLLFVALAARSAWGRRRFIAAPGDLTMTMTPRASELQRMSVQQFELLIGEAFRRKGYSIVDKGARGSRIDLLLQKAGERCLVSIKQWRAIRVGVNTVRELAEAMADRRVARGIVVTTGVFTDEALNLARASGIDAMDGAALRRLTRGVSVPVKVFRDPLSILTRGAPYCPECQGRMVKKRARDGAGYWRCVRHPDCTGKRPL